MSELIDGDKCVRCKVHRSNHDSEGCRMFLDPRSRHAYRYGRVPTEPEHFERETARDDSST